MSDSGASKRRGNIESEWRAWFIWNSVISEWSCQSIITRPVNVFYLNASGSRIEKGLNGLELTGDGDVALPLTLLVSMATSPSSLSSSLSMMRRPPLVLTGVFTGEASSSRPAGESPVASSTFSLPTSSFLSFLPFFVQLKNPGVQRPTIAKQQVNRLVVNYSQRCAVGNGCRRLWQQLLVRSHHRQPSANLAFPNLVDACLR